MTDIAQAADTLRVALKSRRAELAVHERRRTRFKTREEEQAVFKLLTFFANTYDVDALGHVISVTKSPDVLS